MTCCPEQPPACKTTAENTEFYSSAGIIFKQQWLKNSLFTKLSVLGKHQEQENTCLGTQGKTTFFNLH
jgi:hypothetical protein